MQIRMTDDFTYPLDEMGSVERTLPRGYVFDEPDVIAQAAIDAGKAERFDDETASVEAAAADYGEDAGSDDPAVEAGDGAGGGTDSVTAQEDGKATAGAGRGKRSA